VIRALGAVAHDAFREARDRKVSRVLLVLSVALAAGIACVGFREKEPGEFVAALARRALSPYAVEPRVVSVERRETGAARRSGRIHAVIALSPADGPGARDEPPPAGVAVAAVARALERRGLRVESSGEGAGGIELTCAYDDALDVVGLMNLRIAGLAEVDLDFGRAAGDPALADLATFSARYFLATIEGVVAGIVAGWAGIIVAVVATAGFVPSMLQPGTAHLLLARPNRRAVLLLGKYAGGVAFVFAHATLLVALVAAAIFARTGWFDARFLLVAAVLAGLFAIVYAVSCVAGVIFESATTAALLALGFWLGCWAVGTAKYSLPAMRDAVGKQIEVPAALERAVEAAYWVLPKTTDLGRLADRIAHEGREPPPVVAFTRRARPQIDFAASLATSAAFTAALLAAGCWVFARRDY
jgi:hypothetical protein